MITRKIFVIGDTPVTAFIILLKKRAPIYSEMIINAGFDVVLATVISLSLNMRENMSDKTIDV